MSDLTKKEVEALTGWKYWQSRKANLCKKGIYRGKAYFKVLKHWNKCDRILDDMFLPKEKDLQKIKK